MRNHPDGLITNPLDKDDAKDNLITNPLDEAGSGDKLIPNPLDTPRTTEHTGEPLDDSDGRPTER